MYGIAKYSLLEYGNNNNKDSGDINLYRPDLCSYLPQVLREIREFETLYSIVEEEIALLRWNIKNILDQCFVDTATWGLALWEDSYDVKTDINKSYEERREILKAKKRGQGIITSKMLKETAEAFSGGEVDVIEHPEAYSFTVKFIGVKGIPRNLAAFKDMIDTIKPAHLAYDFKFTYTTWNMLNQNNLLWNNSKTWDALKVFE